MSLWLIDYFVCLCCFFKNIGVAKRTEAKVKCQGILVKIVWKQQESHRTLTPDISHSNQAYPPSLLTIFSLVLLSYLASFSQISFICLTASVLFCCVWVLALSCFDPLQLEHGECVFVLALGCDAVLTFNIVPTLKLSQLHFVEYKLKNTKWSAGDCADS